MRIQDVLVCAVVAACSPAARPPGGGDDDGADAPNNSGGDGGTGERVFVYAHTASTLFQVDPDTLAVQEIGDFTFTTGRDDITDIAIDKNNLMIGMSFDSIYRIDPETAAATRLSNNLTGEFNGMSFVPAEALGQTGDDVLVATRNSDGVVFRIDPGTGGATQIGNMGGFSSSGDLVSVAMLGTFQTADNGLGADLLVRLAQGSFTATQIGDTGFAEIWGLAFWKNKLFGFTNRGDFVTIDVNTGVATLVGSSGNQWWGAAVTTLALVTL